MLYTGFLIENKKQSSTVKSYISAIRCVLQEDGVELNDNKVLIKSLTKACMLKNDQVRTRLPIRKGLLQLMIKSVPGLFSAPQPYLICLYWAMLSTAYYGLFRIGEISHGPHVVKAVDVKLARNKNKVMFILHTSKMHGRNKKPQIIKISAPDGCDNNRALCCPFQLLREYFGVRPMVVKRDEQFFIFGDYSPVTPAHFRTLVKRLIAHNCLNPDLYDSTGFRSGHATDMAEQHISPETIRKLGRWKSNAMYTYLRT